jgi:hypothetical protein
MPLFCLMRMAPRPGIRLWAWQFYVCPPACRPPLHRLAVAHRWIPRPPLGLAVSSTMPLRQRAPPFAGARIPAPDAPATGRVPSHKESL